MRPNCRSSGVATADAMVCGSAPGSPAPTLMTGKSIFGREATGRKLNARILESRSAAANSDVPIGLRINGAEILIVQRGTPNPLQVRVAHFSPLLRDVGGTTAELSSLIWRNLSQRWVVQRFHAA